VTDPTTAPEGSATVIGTGSMAPEIAVALTGAGLAVTIAGRSAAAAAAARDRAHALAPGGGAIGAAVIGAGAVAGASLVVETIVEDLAAKRELLARISGWLAPGAVVATNTSSLRIGDLATALGRPGALAGLHFLKPAHLTAVVEVIPGPATDAATTEGLVGLAGRMGRRALVVREDVPGFIWNRIQFAVLRECLHMLESGVATAADIDSAVSDGLAPRWMAAGPLATADLGGLPTFARVSAQLFPELSAARDVPEALEGAARDGRPLAPWTATAAAAVADLREAALAMGREIAARRAGLGA
jgi:3-hydroxybutyryl-CoA dehydrogenase